MNRSRLLFAFAEYPAVYCGDEGGANRAEALAKAGRLRRNSALIPRGLPRGALLTSLAVFSLLFVFSGRLMAGEVHRLLAENDFVRILEANLAPGQKTKLHSHPDSVSVVLDPGTVKVTQKGKCKECERMKKGNKKGCHVKGHTCPMGKARQVNLTRRGEVVFHKADEHIIQNVGQTFVRTILVEFKGLKSGDRFRLPSPHKRVGSNRTAVAYEVNVSPGEVVPEHTHGHHVIVSLDPGQAEIVEGNKTIVRTFMKDAVAFAGPGTHSAKNTGKTPLHLVDIELK